MRRWLVGVVFSGVLVASSARADRVQVYSVQGVDCADCGTEIKAGLKKLKGVKKSEFDIFKVEISVTMDDKLTDQAVMAAIARSGESFSATVGPGKGAYLPFGKYPEGADVISLTESGAAVGPLEKLRVPGKFTVFDVYADWCGPCRVVDSELRELVAARQDVAVRKLNVVDFKTPLARELGTKLKALPHVVVFTPQGARTDLTGPTDEKLAEALPPAMKRRLLASGLVAIALGFSPGVGWT